MKRTIIALAIGLMVPTAASAFTIDINTFLTGSVNTTNATVATLTLTQNGANVDFSFANSVHNLAGNVGDDAFISKLLFSYDGQLGGAPFSNFGGTQLVSANNFTINPNGKDAAYDFYLDLGLPTSANGNRFFDGEVATWTINNVLVGNFTHPVSGSGVDALALVHIQQVGAGVGGTGSLKYIGNQSVEINPTVTVPEPGTVALMGLGLLGLGFATRRKFND
jgi:hypothetical protein